MGGDQDTSIGAERVKEAWLQILMADFDRLKMKDTATIDEFVGELSKISSKSAALGEDMEEANLAKTFLKSLPYKKYIHIVATLEQVMDLKTTSFEDIIGWLKAYEEWVCDDEETQDDQSKLLYANSDSQPTWEYNDYRGRVRGGSFYNRGRGCGRFNCYNNYNAPRDASKVTCFRCDKTGYFAFNCMDRLLKLQETRENENNETQEVD